MFKRLLLILSIFSLLVINACTIHRLDVQQGNIIKEEQIEKLKPGISKRQVRFIMGSPLIQDPFHDNRWDYVFTMQPGTERKVTEYQHIAIYFEEDKLSKFEKY
jgi:outer membrane protein assembly factor BamE